MNREDDRRQLATRIERELERLLEHERGVVGVKVFLEGPDGQPVADRELPAGLLYALLPIAAKRAIVAAVEDEERERRDG